MTGDTNQRPDPLADLAPGYKPPTAPAPPAPPRTQPTTARRRDDNPYLTAMLAIGAPVAFVGLLVYIAGLSSDSLYDGSSGQILLGAGLLSLGVMLLLAWATASAICWQIRRSQL